jgi:hypothetical protein
MEITEPVVTPTPALRAVVGVGVLTAAKIVGETAGAARFKSPAAFARQNGTAPLEAQKRTGPAPSRAGNSVSQTPGQHTPCWLSSDWNTRGAGERSRANREGRGPGPSVAVPPSEGADLPRAGSSALRSPVRSGQARDVVATRYRAVSSAPVRRICEGLTSSRSRRYRAPSSHPDLTDLQSRQWATVVASHFHLANARASDGAAMLEPYPTSDDRHRFDCSLRRRGLTHLRTYGRDVTMGVRSTPPEESCSATGSRLAAWDHGGVAPRPLWTRGGRNVGGRSVVSPPRGP